MDKDYLYRNYVEKKLSMKQIAELENTSVNKVDYWLRKHKIPKRNRSEANYALYNPDGDPFNYVDPVTMDDAVLLGIGLGLYWGEGTKASKNSVRLGNTDPDMILVFIKFLEACYQINKEELKFSIQTFSDTDYKLVEEFWIEKLSIDKAQLTKTTVTNTGKVGSYRQKSKYGVLTLYFHNTKLRNAVFGLMKKTAKKILT